MRAFRIRARIAPRRRLIWLEPTPRLQESEVDVILLYTHEKRDVGKQASAEWPVLDGGRYLGGTLRREEIYDDAR